MPRCGPSIAGTISQRPAGPSNRPRGAASPSAGTSFSACRTNVRTINSLPLTTVKFHQLQILDGTRMAALYDDHPERFRHWSAETYIELLAEMLRRLRPDIVVERIVNQTPPRFRSRGSWSNLRSGDLWRMLEKRLLEKKAHQGDFLYLCNNVRPQTPEIH